jgi:hypothetical protein
VDRRYRNPGRGEDFVTGLKGAHAMGRS